MTTEYTHPVVHVMAHPAPSDETFYKAMRHRVDKLAAGDHNNPDMKVFRAAAVELAVRMTGGDPQAIYSARVAAVYGMVKTDGEPTFLNGAFTAMVEFGLAAYVAATTPPSDPDTADTSTNVPIGPDIDSDADEPVIVGG